MKSLKNLIHLKKFIPNKIKYLKNANITEIIKLFYNIEAFNILDINFLGQETILTFIGSGLIIGIIRTLFPEPISLITSIILYSSGIYLKRISNNNIGIEKILIPLLYLSSWDIVSVLRNINKIVGDLSGYIFLYTTYGLVRSPFVHSVNISGWIIYTFREYIVSNIENRIIRYLNPLTYTSIFYLSALLNKIPETIPSLVINDTYPRTIIDTLRTKNTFIRYILFLLAHNSITNSFLQDSYDFQEDSKNLPYYLTSSIFLISNTILLNRSNTNFLFKTAITTYSSLSFGYSLYYITREYLAKIFKPLIENLIELIRKFLQLKFIYILKEISYLVFIGVIFAEDFNLISLKNIWPLRVALYPISLLALYFFQYDSDLNNQITLKNVISIINFLIAIIGLLKSDSYQKKVFYIANTYLSQKNNSFEFLKELKQQSLYLYILTSYSILKGVDKFNGDIFFLYLMSFNKNLFYTSTIQNYLEFDFDRNLFIKYELSLLPVIIAESFLKGDIKIKNIPVILKNDNSKIIFSVNTYILLIYNTINCSVNLFNGLYGNNGIDGVRLIIFTTFYIFGNIYNNFVDKYTVFGNILINLIKYSQFSIYSGQIVGKILSKINNIFIILLIAIALIAINIFLVINNINIVEIQYYFIQKVIDRILKIITSHKFRFSGMITLK